jgi:hypothetical protein
VSDPLAAAGRHLREHFAGPEPDVASITFLGVERMDVLRFAHDSVYSYVSLGCSRHPMIEASAAIADPVRGPRAEVAMTLRAGVPTPGLARSLAVIAATPAVDGIVLTGDLLVDLSTPLWDGAPFTAVLLGVSDIPELPLEPPREPVRFLSAVPITQTEAAWVRLKGAEAMRQAWSDDGVDVLDPARPASSPN